MRISELAEATAVPVATLKYYLREGVLMPGVATSRTRAGYDQAHVDRVRLIRALIESGGLGIAGVRAVVEAIETPPDSVHDFLGVAHRAVPPPAAEGAVTDEVRELVEAVGWHGCAESPLLGSLATAVADARAAGLPLPTKDLKKYAAAARAWPAWTSRTRSGRRRAMPPCTPWWSAR